MPSADPIFDAAVESARRVVFWRAEVRAGRAKAAVVEPVIRMHEQQVCALGAMALRLAEQPPTRLIQGLDVTELPNLPELAAAHHALLAKHATAIFL